MTAWLASAGRLPAQATYHTSIGLAAGAVGQPGYGLFDAPGGLATLTLTRYLPYRTALRVEAEYQFFGARQNTVIYPPCSGVPCFNPPVAAPAVSISTGSVLTSLEWYGRPSHAGFYVLAGGGPQFIISHPDRPHILRFVVQGGAGLAIPIASAALLIEARYQRNLGASVRPLDAVPVTLGFRMGVGR